MKTTILVILCLIMVGCSTIHKPTPEDPHYRWGYTESVDYNNITQG